MGEIRLFFATSLDGYIADPQGGVTFLDPFHGDSSSYEEFFTGIGTLVMGRRTYQFAEDYGSWPYRKLRVIVLTHRSIEHPITELETRVVEDFSAFARELRQSDDDVWILGGADVMGAFLSAGEVDTIEMSIVPVVIGNGVPMYIGRGGVTQRFKLVKCAQRPDGVVRLIYQR